MTYEELIKVKNNLDKIGFVEDADPKFLYAVSKNKQELEKVIKTLKKLYGLKLQSNAVLTSLENTANKSV